MKSIILIAPPSAGKGTISKMLCEKYHLPHISTGDLLRSAVENDDEQGNYIKQQMNLGKLVSDDIIISLVEKRILDNDCANGYILDGFPRNLTQLKKYESFLINENKDLGVNILLDISYEQAKGRILGRVSCPKCGTVYNIYTSDARPKVFGICDKCGSDLIRRSDDTEEVFKERYATYLNETKPVADYFKSQNRLHVVDSSIEISKVFEQIERILEKEND